jgi:uncharacterized RDD family membrane protein YckC
VINVQVRHGSLSPHVALTLGVGSEVKGHLYAGFWRRLAAWLIDSMVLGAVQLLIAAFVQLLAPNDFQAQAQVLPISIFLGWAYYSLLESSPAQATLGKLALGIVVTDVRGDPISFRRASIRYWAKVLSTLMCMVGWLMAAFTPTKRALHDVLAGTLVLQRATVPLLVAGDDTVAGEHWDGQRWVAAGGPPVERRG